MRGSDLEEWKKITSYVQQMIISFYRTDNSLNLNNQERSQRKTKCKLSLKTKDEVRA